MFKNSLGVREKMDKYDSVVSYIENPVNKVRKRLTYIYKDKINIQSLFNAFIELEKQGILTRKSLGMWTLNRYNTQTFKFDLTIIEMDTGIMVWTYTYHSK